MTKRVVAAAVLFGSLLLTAPVFAAEYIYNGNLAITGKNALPDGWMKGFGGNYSVRTTDGKKVLRVGLSQPATGDGKWYSKEIPVSAGQELVFAHEYLSDSPSRVMLRLKNNSGFSYFQLNNAPSNKYISHLLPYRRAFTVPAGVQTVSIWHSLVGNGEAGNRLDTTSFSLTDATPFTPGFGENMVRNADLAELDVLGRPAHWTSTRSGNAKALFQREICGGINVECPGAAKYVLSWKLDSVANPTGAASWTFEPASLNAGTNRHVSLLYAVNSEANVKVQPAFYRADGSVMWGKVTLAPDTDGVWRDMPYQSTNVPDDAVKVRFYFSLANGVVPPGQFSYVTNVSMVQ